jgi:hypothetical protein
MSDMRFNIQPVEEKPDRKKAPYRTGSKYEPIIDTFLNSEHEMVRVDGTGIEANYLSGQLKKIITVKEIDSVQVSVRNKEVYLEKR